MIRPNWLRWQRTPPTCPTSPAPHPTSWAAVAGPRIRRPWPRRQVGRGPVALTSNSFRAGSTDSCASRCVLGRRHPGEVSTRQSQRPRRAGLWTYQCHRGDHLTGRRCRRPFGPFVSAARAGRAPPQSIRRPDRERTTGPTDRARSPNRRVRLDTVELLGTSAVTPVGQRGPDLAARRRHPRAVRRRGVGRSTARRRH